MKRAHLLNGQKRFIKLYPKLNTYKSENENYYKYYELQKVDDVQKISDVINDLEVDYIMKYIKRLYYYFEVHEYNRYIDVIQKMKPI